MSDPTAAADSEMVVDDSLLTPLFHDDPGTSSSSSSSPSPHEWSSYFSSTTTKPLIDNWAMLDLDPSLANFISDPHYTIDPTATLHFPPSQDLFQFTVTRPLEEDLSQLPSSISSAASSDFSPESCSAIDPSELDLYAQRATQATGVLMAVRAPINPSTPLDVSPVSNDSNPTKLPIPRLRPTPTSTPQPQLQPASIKPDSLPSPFPATLTKGGRPKTSHTTIERRYRTNLNARILALKRAVPALRILEKAANANAVATQGKGMTGACVSKWDFNDVVNERGYVDGVKAAKKNSKGVVLGKAVEYIKSLKRRETRLKREADGLRALICSLVGGTELFREWETEWRARFGGEEMDEVEEGEGAVGEDELLEEEEEEEDEEEGGGESVGRAKKRRRGGEEGGVAKMVTSTAAAAAPGEKRKRGRPRKNPSSVAATMRLQMHDDRLVLQPPPTPQAQGQTQATVPQVQAGQPPTYYLAGVLLFNFLWSAPPSSSSPPPTHEGTVLTHHHTTTPTTSSSFLGFGIATWGTREVVNLVALLVVLIPLVKAYVDPRVASWTQFWKNGRRGEEAMTLKLRRVFEKREDMAGGDEVEKLLEVGRVWGFGKAVMRRIVKGSALAAAGSPASMSLASSSKPGSEAEGDDVQVLLWAWRHVAENLVLNPETTFFARIHTYLRLSSLLLHSTSRLTTNDCIILSLLIKPFSLSSAVAWWTRAEAWHKKHEVEEEEASRLVLREGPVLEGIVIGVGMEKTAEVVGFMGVPGGRMKKGRGVLWMAAEVVVREWLVDLAKRGFVDVVNNGGTAASAGATTTNAPCLLSSLLVRDEESHDALFVMGVKVLGTTATDSASVPLGASASRTWTTGARKDGEWRDVMKLLEGVLRGCATVVAGPSVASGYPGVDASSDFEWDMGVDLDWGSSVGSASSSDDASSSCLSEDENSNNAKARRSVRFAATASSSLQCDDTVAALVPPSPCHSAKLYLLATLLYVRIVTTSSFSRQDDNSSAWAAAEELDTLKLNLRRALASEVFDDDEGVVEEARDRVVDFLDEMEGMGRGMGRW